MSNEETNPYIPFAEERLLAAERAVTQETVHAQATVANAEATLALAFEQKTANLLALYRDNDIGDQVSIDYEDVAKQVKRRLGL